MIGTGDTFRNFRYLGSYKIELRERGNCIFLKGTVLIELSCMHVVCAACVNKTLASLLLLEKVQSSVSNMILSISVF